MESLQLLLLQQGTRKEEPKKEKYCLEKSLFEELKMKKVRLKIGLGFDENMKREQNDKMKKIQK